MRMIRAMTSRLYISRFISLIVKFVEEILCSLLDRTVTETNYRMKLHVILIEKKAT